MDPIIQQDRLNIAGKPAQEQLDSKRIVTKKSENTNPNVEQPVNQPNATMNGNNQVNPNANIMGNN